MKKCAFITLGCKVNQYETQALREAIMSNGYEDVEASSCEKTSSADLYVINTCTVTSTSDEKSRQQIRRVIRRNPEARVIVTGCYAETSAEEIKKIKGVDNVFEKGREGEIVNYIKNGFVSDNSSVPASNRTSNTMPSTMPLWQNKASFDLKISKFDGHTRAFLKVEDGCDNLCSYCIIPYVRGNVVSKKIEDIVFEAEQLVSNGYKEIVLTGIHLGAYGKETGYQFDILDIVKKLEKLPGLNRIRLSSIDANEVTDDLIDVVANSEKICPHFHLPLQSGDDYVLKRMNRKYNTAQYLRILEKIRERIELPSISTDIIVGFPGETSDLFENTLKLCEKAGFSRAHIFPFSPRDNTPAAKMSGQCTPSEIKARKKELEAMTTETSLRYKTSFIGKNINILVEKKRDKKTGKLCGHSDRYIRVLFDGADTLMNEMVDVHVEKVLHEYALCKLSK